ncbi:tetratricopeptide repeat protein [Nonomuraea turkmeniaca]|uniref:Tetratricopeptide repeat protein n=1 Tax=Nonomuraea turkmeniaca TaxID=103838 RepID=A0A5S4EVH8_9ACTN|nr:tetratricopeptide repeat protein [Nonomuraea turkmeniaca]TMR07592.1 tetratricopeptide repeat protein [Nonomuraea turkmeniaca]
MSKRMPGAERALGARSWRSVAVAAVAVLAVSLAAGLAWFFADPLHLPAGVLAALDQRASVVSMITGMTVGVAGLVVAVLALRAQTRADRTPPVAIATPEASAEPTPPQASAGGERSIAVGGDNTGIVSTGDGTRNVQMRAQASGQGRVYQAGGDQTINHVNSPVARRPLPDASSVRALHGVSGLPRRPTLAFVGRDTAMAAVRGALSSGASPGVISQALFGLGGVGKSELALQYAHRYRSEYRPVWWIDSDSPAQIQAGLASLARALTAGTDSVAAEQATVEEAAAWALSWLSMRPDWLIVFDNVEEAADIEPYLARLAHGHLLITTRRDIGWQHLGIQPLRLELLTRSASAALLAELIGPPDAADTAALKELAEQLGDLPLALTQAGAYVARTPGMSLHKYLDLLKKTPVRMLSTAPAAGDAGRVVAKVWMLSHARIQAINPLAAHLLNVLACFAPDHLPCTVLTGVENADELQVNDALALLASYSLITVTMAPRQGQDGQAEDLISVHRLVQAVTLHQLTPAQLHDVRRNAAGLLLAALPDEADKPANWPVYRALLPHARIVLPLDSPGWKRLLRYLGASGDYRNAVHLGQQVLTHTTNTLGPEHPDILTARHDLAVWKGDAGDPITARDQLAALVPDCERVLGPDHRDTLATRHDLAYWTGYAGDEAAARDQLALLLPIRERVLGAEHRDTLSTRNQLARWTGRAGHAAAARDQLAALVPICERVLGADDRDTLTARHDLAIWTGYAGDTVAARHQLAALLAPHERVFGAEHPYTLICRNQLARWTGETGDAVAARDQLAALVPVCERVVGADHRNTLIARHDLAIWTGEAGEPAAARDQLAALLHVCKRVLGTTDPVTRAVWRDLVAATRTARRSVWWCWRRT